MSAELARVQAKRVNEDLYLLGCGLKGLGTAVSNQNDTENLGFLTEILGRYTERLARDLEESLNQVIVETK